MSTDTLHVIPSGSWPTANTRPEPDAWHLKQRNRSTLWTWATVLGTALRACQGVAEQQGGYRYHLGDEGAESSLWWHMGPVSGPAPTGGVVSIVERRTGHETRTWRATFVADDGMLTPAVWPVR